MRSLTTFLSAMLLAGLAVAQTGAIVVNGEQLSYEQIVSYEIAVPDGRYWYDPQSGL